MTKKQVTGGYCGFHNENYLRSSYEYVYCKILEKLDIDYTIEEQIYDLKDRNYIPDFHLYDKGGKLIKVVEIKSSKPEELEKAEKAKSSMKELFNIDCEIFQYSDLIKKCNDLNLNFNELSNYWKENSEGRNIMSGKLNPMYGKKHSEETLSKISKSSLERWEDDEFRKELSDKRKEYFKNPENRKKASDLKKEYYKNKRAELQIEETKIIECNNCGKKIEVRYNDRKEKYCSRECSIVNATKIANDKVRENNKKFHDSIRLELYELFLNKDKTDINDLLKSKKRNLIYKDVKKVLLNNNLKDIRNFKFIILGKYSGSFEELYDEFVKQINIYLKNMPNLQDDKL